MGAMVLPIAFLLFCTTHGAPTGTKIIDLGYDMSNNTQWWPGVQKFEIIEKTRNRNQNGIPWFAVNTFKTAEHVGTHVDAPYHFDENGWKLGDIPMERFFVPGQLIDVSKEVNDNFNFVLQPRHVYDWEKKNGKKIQKETVVLIRFGWSKKYYSNHDDYFGIGKSNDSDLNFPGVSKEAAQVFIDRGVYGIGLDTPSLDPGKNVLFEAHQKWLKESKFGIENLDLSSTDIPATDFMVNILPMKITEGTGAPARVLAIVNEQKPKDNFVCRFLSCY